MSGYKGSNFNDRRTAAADAKKARAESFHANKPAPDDPAVLARQAERRAIIEARDIRNAERKVAKEAEAERLRLQDTARIAAEATAAAEAEARAIEQATRDEAIKAERKAARDAKYAARKARR